MPPWQRVQPSNR